MPGDDGIKLFVYGISASCPRDLLEDKFGKFGRVNDVFNTGKGYAFITMDDEAGAQDAIEDLHGSSIDGQEVKVELSKPRPRGGGGGDRTAEEEIAIADTVVDVTATEAEAGITEVAGIAIDMMTVVTAVIETEATIVGMTTELEQNHDRSNG